MAPRTVKSEVAKHVDRTPRQWSGEDTEDSQEDEGDRKEAESLIATDNEAMASLSKKKKQRLANYHGLGHEVSSNAISRKTERLVW